MITNAKTQRDVFLLLKGNCTPENRLDKRHRSPSQSPTNSPSPTTPYRPPSKRQNTGLAPFVLPTNDEFVFNTKKCPSVTTLPKTYAEACRNRIPLGRGITSTSRSKPKLQTVVKPLGSPWELTSSDDDCTDGDYVAQVSTSTKNRATGFLNSLSKPRTISVGQPPSFSSNYVQPSPEVKFPCPFHDCKSHKRINGGFAGLNGVCTHLKTHIRYRERIPQAWLDHNHISLCQGCGFPVSSKHAMHKNCRTRGIDTQTSTQQPNFLAFGNFQEPTIAELFSFRAKVVEHIPIKERCGVALEMLNAMKLANADTMRYENWLDLLMFGRCVLRPRDNKGKGGDEIGDRLNAWKDGLKLELWYGLPQSKSRVLVEMTPEACRSKAKRLAHML